MPGSSNGDRDQRKSTTMDNSTEMTIEFLRARLLSERSVSKAARQRAGELANRVTELEEQLKIVSLRRKKVEKATAVVLAILKNHRISDVSEALDSSSDQDVSHHESKVGNNLVEDEETSAIVQLKRNGMEAFSGTELESSPLTGRSLSWKNGKDSPYYREKKRYIDSSRRRCSSFSSAGSFSAKHVGKSCRRIKCREARSDVEGLQSACMHSLQHDGIANSSEDLHNCHRIKPGKSREGAESHEKEDVTDVPVLEAREDQKRFTGSKYMNGHGGDRDIESALEHQAQLIGQYEAEEIAQREWEEKFRGNKICSLDSCDPGNDSDVTEERGDDDKAPAPEGPLETLSSQNRDSKIGAQDIGSREESKTINGFCPPMHVDMGYLQHQGSSSIPGQQSLTSEFAFPSAEAEHIEKGVGNIKSLKGFNSNNFPNNQLANISTSQAVTGPSEGLGNIKSPEGFNSNNFPNGHLADLSTSYAVTGPSKVLGNIESPEGFSSNNFPNNQSTDLSASRAVTGSEGLGNIKSPEGFKSTNFPDNHFTGIFASHAVNGHHRHDAPGSENELALVPQTSYKLQSVLGALQQAKLSLEQKISQSSVVPSIPNKFNQSSLVECGPVGTAMAPYLPDLRKGDRLEGPVGCAGNFRVPTDHQLEATSQLNFQDLGAQLGLVSYSRGTGSASTAGDRFLTSTYLESRSRSSDSNQIFTMPPRVPTWKPMDERLAFSKGYAHLNQHFSGALPSFSKFSCPTFHPQLIPQMITDGGLSRSLTTKKEAWMPPTANLSLYEDHFRENMCR